MQTFGFLSVPLIIFLAVVAPLWIFFHYVTKWKKMKLAGAAEDQDTPSLRPTLTQRRQGGGGSSTHQRVAGNTPTDDRLAVEFPNLLGAIQGGG